MADAWAPGYIKRLPFIRRFLFNCSYRLNSIFDCATDKLEFDALELPQFVAQQLLLLPPFVVLEIRDRDGEAPNWRGGKRPTRDCPARSNRESFHKPKPSC
jgi:hypothetical protein